VDGYRGTQRERGAAIVEMAIVSMLLFALLYAIINYAYVLSFRQSMSQAAADGARAGAVALAADAQGDAEAAMQAAVDEFHDCTGAMTCDAVVAECPAPSAKDCVFVTVSYDYDADPLMPVFPGLGIVMPDAMEARSVAEVSVEP
jgi:Flp pilus assembly protein TadG